MKRILLTGATGIIGRQLLLQLRAAGYLTHAVHRQAPPEELRPLAKWHLGDLVDPTSTRDILRQVKPQLLLHVAWPLVTGNTNSAQHRTFQHASESLIRQFHHNGGERVVIAGTCFEYDWTGGVCTEDKTPVRPTTVYGSSKLALLQFIESFAARHLLSFAWGRIFFVYGPYQDRTRFVPAIVHGLLNREPVPCTHGRQVRDYLHTQDVASALLTLAESRCSGVCNIGSGEPITLRTLGEKLADLLGGHHLLLFGEKSPPPEEPPVIVADTHRLRQELHWHPRFNLTEGLMNTIEHIRSATTPSFS